MFCCDETVTLVRHETGKNTDTFTCTVIAGASWYGKTVIQPPAQMGNKGVAFANVIKVRIPEENMPEGRVPQTGDYLVRGAMEGVQSMTDFKEREYMKILSVGDNRRGRLRHWAVTGA